MKSVGFCYIRYITTKIISDCESANSVNLLCFIINKVNWFIEEKDGNSYVVIDYTDDENKEVLANYTRLWDEIKISIEKIDNKSGNYRKDFMKIKSE